MSISNVSRSTLIKIGVVAVMVLLLVSRCGGDDVEIPGDIRLSDDFSVSDVQNQLNDMTRIFENEPSMLEVIKETSGGSFNPNSLTREDFLDVWQPTTVPYDPSCSEECDELVVREGGTHGMSGMRLLYNPKVDDPIAQWSDCVMSITLCFEAEADDSMDQREMDDVLKVCVQKSQCPNRCKEVFRAKVEAISLLTVDEELENVFVGEQALCLPREAWVNE